MTEETDKETQEVFKEGETALYLVKNPDWQWAKRRLLQKLSNLDSVKTIKEKGDILLEIKARKMTIDMVLEWLDEIEGVAEQHGEQNKDLLGDVAKEDYLRSREEED